MCPSSRLLPQQALPGRIADHPRAPRPGSRGRGGRDGGGGGRVRGGQEHAAAPARRARPGRCGQRAHRRTGPQRAAGCRAGGVPQSPRGVRLPVPPPAAGVQRARERRDAAAHCPRARCRGAAAGRGDSSSAWGSASGSTIVPACCRAASSSGWRWHGRWSCSPALLLADEPTGDLDEDTADTLHALLREMHAEYGLTSVIATHNPRLAAACDRDAAAARAAPSRLTRPASDRRAIGGARRAEGSYPESADVDGRQAV